MDSVNVQNQDRYQIYNDDYRTPSALELRLSTREICERFELFLRGKIIKERSDPENPSKVITEIIKTGEPLGNDEGIRNIVGIFEGIVNTANVQGNYKVSDYYRYMTSIHQKLAYAFTVNGHKWKIEKHRQTILDKFILQISLFLTRPIDNKEREGYTNIKHLENNTINNQAARNGLFS